MATRLSQLEKSVLNNRLRLIHAEAELDELVRREMHRLIQEWEQELNRIVGSRSKMRATQVEDLGRKLNIIRDQLTKKTKARLSAIEKIVGDQSKSTFKYEVFKHASIVDGHVVKFEGRKAVSFKGLNERAINAAYRQKFPPGFVKQAFGKVSAQFENRLRRDIADAIANGWNVDQLARQWKRLGGAAGITRSAAQANARTMIMQASSNAQLHAYSLQDNVIKGVQWEATFDSRTCPVCAGRHGKQYARNEAPSQPAHFNCRCTWLPVFIDESLNTKLDTRKAYKKPNNPKITFKKESREFEQWLKTTSVNDRREFFKSRIKQRAWQDGKLSLDQLVDVHGNFISDQTVLSMVDRKWAERVLKNLDNVSGRPKPKISGVPKGQLSNPFTP